MSEFHTLKSKDGHQFEVYITSPEEKTNRAIILIQEIFGVNSHIRSVADKYAHEGFLVYAPALFDRIRPGIELGYTENEIKEGFDYVQDLGFTEKPLIDLEACFEDLRSKGCKVATIGYCWGGLLSFASATSFGLNASISYYPGSIGMLKDQKPNCPVLIHFGEQDSMIPLTEVEAFSQAQQEVQVHMYPSGHGFNCDARGSFDRNSADLAFKRSLDFLKLHLS
ncbi:MAG: dienelactone hydrolase family protein [Candidatus Caenarcaniphilales bacterium]|nr:dienelactone hydrolase family protein [Candidatus Caenarcaniphilales bacterium]